METTSITLDQGTAMRLRAVKNDMSTAAGHVIPLREVVAALIASWRERQDSPS